MGDLPGWLAALHADSRVTSAASRVAAQSRRPRPRIRANDSRPVPRYEDLQPLQDRFFRQRDEEASRRFYGGQLNRLPDQEAQAQPDPIHTPLERGIIDTSRMVLPGAYDAGAAGARIAQGDNSAWGDLALNSGLAALPFLGVRGTRERGPIANDAGAWRDPLPPPVRRYPLNVGDHAYDVRVTPQLDFQDAPHTRASVSFARIEPDGSETVGPTGDTPPADALRLMRGITQTLGEDARVHAPEAYDWMGTTPRQSDLYGAMLSRYGTPEGYYASSSPRGPRVMRWPDYGSPPEAPRTPSPDAGASLPEQTRPLPDGGAGGGGQTLRPPGPNEYDVYHGTANEFDQFSPQHRGSNYSHSPDAKDAFFFTSDPEHASRYATVATANMRGVSSSPEYQAARRNALAARDSVERAVLPWTRAARDERYRSAEEARQRTYSEGQVGANVRPARLHLENPLVVNTERAYNLERWTRIIREARDAGHDGVIFRGVEDMGHGQGTQDVFAVFDPSNIRSRFDPEHLSPPPNAGASPPTPKSYRRKPPSGGFFIGEPPLG